MAVPEFLGAMTGATDAGGAWSFTPSTSWGEFTIIQIVQDGTTNGAVAVTSVLDIEDLAGNDDAITQIPGPNADGSWPIGSPESARQFLWCGRQIAGTSDVIAGSNSTSEDLYFRAYRFREVNAGTTLADVIENGSAGTALNGTGTGTTVSDTDVTTLGADRLALQLVGLNDDVAIDAFTGMTGGTWGEAVAEYAEASGTDAALQLQTAQMTSAGTIGGGSDTIVSAGWGVVGFALIGTTAGGPADHFGAVASPFTFERVVAGTVTAFPESLIYQPGIQAAIPRSLYVR